MKKQELKTKIYKFLRQYNTFIQEGMKLSLENPKSDMQETFHKLLAYY